MTALKRKHIDDLHFEHQLWLSELNLFADELNIYVNRLTEISAKNTGEEIRKKIEHFQNQFILQKQQLDILNHDIKLHEQLLSSFAKEHPIAIDHHLFSGHTETAGKVATYRSIYNSLKQAFGKFLEESF
jgi:hypothetical protein